MEVCALSHYIFTSRRLTCVLRGVDAHSVVSNDGGRRRLAFELLRRELEHSCEGRRLGHRQPGEEDIALMKLLSLLE